MTQPAALKITLLGATGSIGSSTLDVIGQHPGRYQIHALTANTNVDALADLCETWSPRYAVMNDETSAAELTGWLQNKNIPTIVLSGEPGLLRGCLPLPRQYASYSGT